MSIHTPNPAVHAEEHIHTSDKPWFVRRIWNTLTLKNWREKRKKKKQEVINAKVSALETKLLELQKTNQKLYAQIQQETQAYRKAHDALQQEIKNTHNNKAYIKVLENKIAKIEGQNKKFEKVIKDIDSKKAKTISTMPIGSPVSDTNQSTTHASEWDKWHEHTAKWDHHAEDHDTHTVEWEDHGHTEDGHGSKPADAHH